MNIDHLIEKLAYLQKKSFNSLDDEIVVEEPFNEDAAMSELLADITDQEEERESSQDLLATDKKKL